MWIVCVCVVRCGWADEGGPVLEFDARVRASWSSRVDMGIPLLIGWSGPFASGDRREIIRKLIVHRNHDEMSRDWEIP